MGTDLGRLARIAELHKAQEAEERLNFIADVAVLFSKDSKRHVDGLVRQAEMVVKKEPKLYGTVNGKFVPGKSYIVE
jgi:hypothetical protein